GLAGGAVLLVPEAALGEVAVEVRTKRAGEPDDPVLAALAVADGELMPGQVEVVDAELAALLAAQAGAVEQAGPGGGRSFAAGQRVEETVHLVGREHRGQPFGPPGRQGVQPGQLEAETWPVAARSVRKRSISGAPIVPG